MNIDINSNIRPWANALEGVARPAVARPTDQVEVKSTGGLTITQSAAAPEDIAIADISEVSLRRDDALGSLVKAAFNLQAPPMPAELTDV